MNAIPPDISLETLPGPKRGEYPALFFRDEIVWSPSRNRFALAYTIAEASMNNEIGCVLWGSCGGNSTTVLGNPEGIYACCWNSPWCVWLNDDVFLFKAQRYDEHRLHIPLVAVSISTGFSVLPGTNNSESIPSQFKGSLGLFTMQDSQGLLGAIQRVA